MAKTKLRRIAKWTTILGLAGIGTLAVIAWLVGTSLIAPATKTVGEPPSDFPATTVTIQSDSGSSLVGWHLPLPESHATAILFHPYRGDRRSMLSRAKLLRKHGYSTLLVDLQAHGESEGDTITVGHLEKHDVTAAVGFIRSNFPDQKIAVIGRSLGGASTVFANPDVDAIVLESVYPTISNAVHNRVQMRIGILHRVVAPLLLVQLQPRLGVSPDQLRPVDEITKIRCPILIASGDRDRHTTIDETKQLFDAASQPKRLVVFEGAEHVDLLAYDASKYENEVIAYIKQVIGERVD